LSKYPIKFQRQKPIGEYIVDFYCAKAKLVIELDGYYHTTDKQYQNDKKRTEEIRKQHLTILRFTNQEIETKFNVVCKKIDAFVKRSVEINEVVES